MERYLRVGEVARLLGVKPRTIGRWLSWNQVRFYTTPGGERRIPESEVERILGQPLDQPHNAPDV